MKVSNPEPEKAAESVAERAAALDLRRQAQIDNQVEVINRLKASLEASDARLAGIAAIVEDDESWCGDAGSAEVGRALIRQALEEEE